MTIQNAYNLWAQQYDSNVNPTRDLDKKSTIESLNKYEFNQVIELGCGTGKNTLWLLKKAKQIIGLDFSQEMLKKAKAKINDARVSFKAALHPFKQYAGSKARFETEAGMNVLEVYVHHTSEYLDCAKSNGFQLIELKEWFDEGKQKEIPRLISFIFRLKR